MGVDGLTFDQAWPNRVRSVHDGTQVFVISREDLILNKKATACPQDLLDLKRLLESSSDSSEESRTGKESGM